MQKVSKRQIVREAQKLWEDNSNLKKECQQLLQMMFGVAVKLYIVTPEDDIFTGDSFKPEFLEAVKKAAEDTKNPPPPAMDGKLKGTPIQEDKQ